MALSDGNEREQADQEAEELHVRSTMSRLESSWLSPDPFMKLYCDWLQARIGSGGLVLKVVEYDLIHSVFQIGARLATAGFRSVSLRVS